ncbi:MAG: hypothetical protein ACFCVE_09415 [Phycisphaerae bacterium]
MRILFAIHLLFSVQQTLAQAAQVEPTKIPAPVFHLSPSEPQRVDPPLYALGSLRIPLLENQSVAVRNENGGTGTATLTFAQSELVFRVNWTTLGQISSLREKVIAGLEAAGIDVPPEVRAAESDWDLMLWAEAAAHDGLKKPVDDRAARNTDFFTSMIEPEAMFLVGRHLKAAVSVAKADRPSFSAQLFDRDGRYVGLLVIGLDNENGPGDEANLDKLAKLTMKHLVLIVAYGSVVEPDNVPQEEDRRGPEDDTEGQPDKDRG